MTCGAGRNTRKQPTPSVCFAGLEMHACAWIDARRAPRRKQTSAHAGLAYAVATCTICFTTSPERAMKPENQWMEIGAGHTVCCLVSHACENRHGQQLCDGWLAGVMDRTPPKKLRTCDKNTSRPGRAPKQARPSVAISRTAMWLASNSFHVIICTDCDCHAR